MGDSPFGVPESEQRLPQVGQLNLSKRKKKGKPKGPMVKIQLDVPGIIEEEEKETPMKQF